MAMNSATAPDNGNPYRNQAGPTDSAGPMTTDDPYHPKAHGLTGQTLDSLLMAAMTEGVNIGHAEGYEAGAAWSQRHAATIWDEGHREGVLAGQASASKAVREAIRDGLAEILTGLEPIYRRTKTGSAQERDVAAVVDAATALANRIAE